MNGLTNMEKQFDVPAEQLRRFPLEVQRLDTSRSVVELAYEHIHHIENPVSGTPALRVFLDELVSQRIGYEAGKKSEVLKDILNEVHQHYSHLVSLAPDAATVMDNHRRFEMWCVELDRRQLRGDWTQEYIDDLSVPASV